MTPTDRQNRRLRLAHSLDTARQLAERRRLAASRALDALGGEATDDGDERARLVEAAADAVAPALAAEDVVRALESELARA
jgi:hypothetical protein